MVDHLERIGETVGDYRLTRWLGGGGFGDVYLAEHLRDGNLVALKILQIHLMQRNELRSFINEARTFRLKHPHIMPLLDFGIGHDDTPFLVMEYAAMGTMRHRHPRGSHVPLHNVVAYTDQMASALQYAHQAGLVHRDVKPENMLLRSRETLLLSDFGIATTVHNTSSQSGNPGVSGTVLYMAPEQLKGKPRKESDQYALAVVVYEWLTGRCPFVGTAIEVATQHLTKPPPSLVEQVSGVPQAVEEVIFKALYKDPRDRFASIQEFASALQQASRLPTILQPTHSISDEELGRPASFTTVPQPTLPVLDEQTQVGSFTTIPQPTQPALDTLLQSVPLTPQRNNPLTPAVEQRPPGHAHGLSNGYKVLLLCLILLLLAGGGYAYPKVRSSLIALQATATAVTQREATATAIATTGTKAQEEYQTDVARNGVMAGFDAQHTHNNPYEVILNVANVSRLQQKWTALTGDTLSSSPVVANGLIYIGSRDYLLYAFDAKTGRKRWSSPTGAIIDAVPAVAHGLVYVGSWDFLLHAFDAKTGRKQWTAHTGGPIISSPTVVNDMVYVGSADSKLYAFDAKSGQQKWVAPTSGSITSSPAVANGLVYVTSHDGSLYAFDARTGQSQWTSPEGDNFSYSAPAVANGLVYAGSEDHQLYAFDAKSGQQKWVAPTGDRLTSSPAVANGLVYIGSWDHQLYAFDAKSGLQKWVAPTGGVITSSPTIANGVIYVGSEDHQLYAFDAKTGLQKWTSPTGGVIFYSSPAVANGQVYIGSQDRQVYAFALPGM